MPSPPLSHISMRCRGEPEREPYIIGCGNLAATPVQSVCPLGVNIAVLDRHSGLTVMEVSIDTWQEGALLDFDFGPALERWNRVELKAIEGAEQVIKEDGSLSLNLSATPAQGHSDSNADSRHGRPALPAKNVVRFAATNVHSFPSLTCVPSFDFAPPKPPVPPPESPPYQEASRDSCFLGGRASFAILPCFGICDLTLSIDRWQTGSTVTVDFGVRWQRGGVTQTAVRIRSFTPKDVIQMTDATKHSITFELLSKSNSTCAV